MIRISSTGSKVRTILKSVINSTTAKYCPVSFSLDAGSLRILESHPQIQKLEQCLLSQCYLGHSVRVSETFMTADEIGNYNV